MLTQKELAIPHSFLFFEASQKVYYFAQKTGFCCIILMQVLQKNARNMAADSKKNHLLRLYVC